MTRPIFTFVLASILAACGETTAPADTGSSDVTNGSDVVDATTQDAAPVMCGTSTCGAGEVCVQPCCGGPAPQCLPPDDAGMCPAGSTPGQCSGPGGPQTGCTMQCTPPPAFCAPRPASGCQGTTCAPCPTGSGVTTGDTISCLCA